MAKSSLLPCKRICHAKTNLLFFGWTLSSEQFLQSNAATTQQLIGALVAFGNGGVCIETTRPPPQKLCSLHAPAAAFSIHSLTCGPLTHLLTHTLDSATHPSPTHPPAGSCMHQTCVSSGVKKLEGLSKKLEGRE